jgi:nucleotide-binding universal stress UspA family protein
MFKTIVLALDGSDHAERAVPVAVDLARTHDGKIVIAHIDERIAAKGDMPPALPNEAQIKKDIEHKAEELSADGVDTSVEYAAVVLGGPAPGIVEIADRVGADVIVAGTRGRSSVTGLLVGSVSHRLLHIAKRPVLAVPPPE